MANIAPHPQSDGMRMNEQQLRKRVVALTHKLIIDHYVARDLDAVVENLADDVTWFGPMDCQQAFSVDELRCILEPEYGNMVKVNDENWGVRIVGGAYVVFGTYEVDLRETGGPGALLHQSVTAVWGLTEEGPRIIHLHVSSAYDVPSRIGEPMERGGDGIAYVVADMVKSTQRQGPKIRFESLGGQVHYLLADEIRYIETKRPVCHVVHLTGSFFIRSSLDKEAQRLPESFIRVHRGYLVNAEHVASFRRYRVVFDNGSECPIAEHRYLAVAAELEQATHRA